MKHRALALILAGDGIAWLVLSGIFGVITLEEIRIGEPRFSQVFEHAMLGSAPQWAIRCLVISALSFLAGAMFFIADLETRRQTKA